MKKIIMTLAAVFCCAMISTVFTSCGSDDDKDSDTAGSYKPVAVSMTTSLSVSDDMINYFDLTVDYYDANGQIQSEPLTEKEWEKTIMASLPATLGACLKAQLKDGVDPSSIAVLKAGSWLSYSYNTLDSKGHCIQAHSSSYGGTLSIEGCDIAYWLQQEGEKIKHVRIVFDADGRTSSN